MKIPPAEIIDRMSIVKLKIEKIGDSELKREFKALKQAIEEFKKEGIEINENWLKELYEINSKEWDLLGKVDEERRKSKMDYKKFADLYSEIEKMNKKRAKAKNKIIEETGIGFKEIKKEHPSE
jgi:Zn-dependent oligopeptidase